MKKTTLTAVVCLVVLFLAGTLLIVFLNRPFTAAILCPPCFGFHKIASDTYIENSATPALAASSIQVVDAARGRVGRFYGPLISKPVFLFTTSEQFYRRWEGRKGQPLAVTLGHAGTLVSPRGDNVVIVSHEMAHAELATRIGSLNLRNIPTWFNEGLAAYISNDPRYIGPFGQANRCLASPNAILPEGEGEWNTKALYAPAACCVMMWLAAHGGTSAVSNLITAIGNGKSFREAYASP